MALQAILNAAAEERAFAAHMAALNVRDSVRPLLRRRIAAVAAIIIH